MIRLMSLRTRRYAFEPNNLNGCAILPLVLMLLCVLNVLSSIKYFNPVTIILHLESILTIFENIGNCIKDERRILCRAV